MSPAAEANRPEKKSTKPLVRVKESPVRVSEKFWNLTLERAGLNEGERLYEIKQGVPAIYFVYYRDAFDLPARSWEILLNVSSSTLERRIREQKPLDTVASERLDRIATVSHLAKEVFEDRAAAAQWMAKANKALGGNSPIMLCETEIGAKQVRRVLHAMEWGGVA